MNLGLQLLAFVMILVGLRYAIKTHAAFKEGKEDGQKYEKTHKNLMTFAVIVSGVGTLIWMLPNFFLGWYYGTSGLGYGTGGYSSYFSFGSVLLGQWYLLAAMVVLGSLTAILGVYLVLRMRWSGFPKALAVENYRRVMILTWSLWFVNLIVGLAVFYFFALPPAPG